MVDTPLSTYPTDTVAATKFVSGVDAGGNVKLFPQSAFSLLSVSGTYTADQAVGNCWQRGARAGAVACHPGLVFATDFKNQRPPTSRASCEECAPSPTLLRASRTRE